MADPAGGTGFLPGLWLVLRDGRGSALLVTPFASGCVPDAGQLGQIAAMRVRLDDVTARMISPAAWIGRDPITEFWPAPDWTARKLAAVLAVAVRIGDGAAG